MRRLLFCTKNEGDTSYTYAIMLFNKIKFENMFSNGSF